MKVALLALAGAAVAVSAVPADARHYTNRVACVRYHHGRCVAWKRLTRAQARAYRVGYVFGPDYAYTPVSALPAPVVTRYSLTPRYRYVYTGGNVYVVDPTSYAVTRVIRAIVP